MERRQLESFVAVVEIGSFHGAADRLFLTQSAVSQSLKALEAELGETLLLRSGGGRGGIGLSAAGELFLPIARDILRRFAAGKQAVQELRGLLRGRLSIGAVDVAALYHLPDPLRSFNDAHPDLAISVRVAGSQSLVDDLRAGELDLAFVLAEGAPQGLVGRPYREDALAVVAPAELLARLGPEPSPETVAEQGWITYPRGTVSRGLIEAAFTEAGLPFPVLMEIDRPEAILQLVRAGLGLAVLPERLLDESGKHETLRRVDLAGLSARRPIHVLHRDEVQLAPAARAFLSKLD